MKRIGPNTEPCGTPLITLATDEKTFSMCVCVFVYLREFVSMSSVLMCECVFVSLCFVCFCKCFKIKMS